MLGKLLLEGPVEYLRLIKKAVLTQCESVTDALIALDAERNREQVLLQLGQVSKGCSFFLRILRPDFPRPPFAAIRELLPPSYDFAVRGNGGANRSQLERYLLDLVLEQQVIEEYLIKFEPGLPQNPFSRFFVRRCKDAKRRRFNQARRRVVIATEGLSAYLISHLDPHLINLQFQQEYQDYAD